MYIVVPAQAGTQLLKHSGIDLGPRFRGGDNLRESYSAAAGT